jgi:hypothetical protein
VHEFEFESIFSLVPKFTPGYNQCESTMGVYLRDLILGQVSSLNFVLQTEISIVSLINCHVHLFLLDVLIVCGIKSL